MYFVVDVYLQHQKLVKTSNRISVLQPAQGFCTQSLSEFISYMSIEAFQTWKFKISRNLMKNHSYVCLNLCKLN